MRDPLFNATMAVDITDRLRTPSGIMVSLMNEGDRAELLIYTSPDGKTRIDVRLQGNSVWLSQAQMAELFQTTKQNVSLHVKNLFEEKELQEASVVKESLTTAQDGKRYSI